MPTATVRVTAETRAVLQELAKESKQPMQRLIARIVEQLTCPPSWANHNERPAEAANCSGLRFPSELWGRARL